MLNVAFETMQPVRGAPVVRDAAPMAGLVVIDLGKHIGYESWLEREHAMLLDFEPDVADFASQPYCLHWTNVERKRRHCAGFLRAS